MSDPKMIEQGRETRTKVVRFLIEYIAEHGYSPSFTEIMTASGLNTLSAVSYTLDRLVKEGVIKKSPVVARSIVVLDPSAYLEEGDNGNG